MKNLIKISSIIIILLFIVPGQSFGQTDTTVTDPDTLQYETDEVVVTATRVQKKIIDIPYPVARLKTTQYKFDRKVSISDVLTPVPGLFMQSRYGNHDVRISIRGFGSRSNTGIRGVRILLDGIPESEPDGQTRIEAIDFNALGSIEIVKGNSSSLYTNAPGGVINFISDINYPSSFAVLHNEMGEFGMHRNGFKVGIRSGNVGFLTTYTYHNYNGYRPHSSDYWHILNSFLEIMPGEHSSFQTMFYFVNGMIRLPGSLTREEFDANPYAPAKTEKDFDFRRESKKGRLGLKYTTEFGSSYNNELELTAYGTIKYFERLSRNYRIMNRYGLGASARWTNRSEFFGLKNEFSLGGDLLYQTGPIEWYNNIGGTRENLYDVSDETIGNSGAFFLNTTELIRNKFSILISGRYDRVYFDQKNRINESMNDERIFEDFTPKVAFSYKLTPSIALYTSYGLSFDSPAGNEMDNFPTSSSPGTLLNPDLQAQESKNFEVGIKGQLISERRFFSNLFFELTFFNIIIENEIVPYEVFSDFYFRNAAETNRTGIEFGANIELVKGLNLNAAYTYSNFSYNNYLLASVDSLLQVSYKDYSGNIVPSVPEHNLYTAVSYAHPITPYLTGFAKVSNLYISEMFVDDANSDKTDSYSLVNLTLGFDFLFNRFNLLLSGGINNLLDETYAAFININSSSGRFFEAGEPRSYFVTLNLGYNF